MAEGHRTADVLRLAGRYVDAVGAARFEIVQHDADLIVSWEEADGRAGHLHCTPLDWESLLEKAREQRGDGPLPATSDWAELLRTLGQELDREGIELDGVSNEDEELHVHGWQAGRAYQARYRLGELRALSAYRRAQRRVPPLA